MCIMKEKLWIFILKFLVISLPLLALWLWRLQDQYLILLNHILTFLLITLAGFNIQYFPAPFPIFINLIPYFSLMVITKGIRLKSRIIWLVVGLLILIGWHMVLTEAIYLVSLKYQIDSQQYEKFTIPLFLFSETLPFLLWILIARKQVEGLFFREKKAG